MKLFIAILLLLPFTLPITGTSQLTVDNTTMTVEQYIQNVLLGGGVTISNVQFNGGSAAVNNEQVGSFTDVSSFVGLGGGLIMGSGDVSMATQANTGGGSSMGGSGSMGSDIDLASITINQIWDEAVLEFDFVPDGDTIKFNYVFASEEYDEYVCGSVNDAFGFFLTGANPAGGLFAAQNIALIPDPANPGQYTTTPVSINTVNLGVAGSNGNLATCTAIDPNFAAYNIYYTQNSGNNYEYDGKTVVLEAKAAVVCGDTYHIKLAIGDGGDSGFDSGVFLEEGSFSSAGVSVEAGIANGDTLLYEGCNSAYFAFSHSDTTTTFVLHFEVAGTAINGIDYTFIPDSIVIPVGQENDTVFVNPYLDGQNDPNESVSILIIYENCGGWDTLVATLTITDYNPLGITFPEDSINVCLLDNPVLNLDATPTGGLPPQSIIWSTGEVTEDITVITPLEDAVYIVTISDQCGNPASDTLVAYVQCPVEPANVFTPNGDGMNDLYSAVNLDDYPHPSIIIYNRWGKIVYQMDDYQNDWDGTHYKSGADLNEGAYYYIITPNSLKYEYTENKKEELKRTLAGYLQLMR